MLNEQTKKEIDEMTDYELLYKWRFSTIGDPLFSDEESGKYFSERLFKIRDENPEKWTQLSKLVGWNK